VLWRERGCSAYLGALQGVTAEIQNLQIWTINFFKGQGASEDVEEKEIWCIKADGKFSFLSSCPSHLGKMIIFAKDESYRM